MKPGCHIQGRDDSIYVGVPAFQLVMDFGQMTAVAFCRPVCLW